MIPVGDENPQVHTPWMTWLIIAVTVAVWVIVQGAGSPEAVTASMCNLGMVPGEITRRAAVGIAVPMAPGLACVIDREPVNAFTPLISMFLHAGWGHLLGNMLFLGIFGDDVEDSMGPGRFLFFYLLCGLVAAAAHIAVDPASPVPTVGASGAISGVMGGYLLLFPQVRIRMLFIFIIFFKVFALPAWLVLLWWFFIQLIAGLPQLSSVQPNVSSGVAFWAHIGGFVAGLAFIRVFVSPQLAAKRDAVRERERARLSGITP